AGRRGGAGRSRRTGRPGWTGSGRAGCRTGRARAGAGSTRPARPRRLRHRVAVANIQIQRGLQLREPAALVLLLLFRLLGGNRNRSRLQLLPRPFEESTARPAERVGLLVVEPATLANDQGRSTSTLCTTWAGFAAAT